MEKRKLLSKGSENKLQEAQEKTQLLQELGERQHIEHQLQARRNAPLVVPREYYGLLNIIMNLRVQRVLAEIKAKKHKEVWE